MEQTRKENTGINDEMTLRDLILKMQEWLRYLWKRKIVIGLFVIIGGSLGAVTAIMSKPKYEGTLTFILEDSKSGGLAAYAGLASQFGLDIGGSGSGAGVFSGENIIEFLQSRLIVEKALLSPVVKDGKTLTLAEMYVNMYDLREKWKKNPALTDLHFPIDKKRETYSLKQDSILYELYLRILAKDLELSKSEKKSSFISVVTTSKEPLFSKLFTEALVREATTFYVDTKTKRFKVNVDKLQVTADSIKQLLTQKTYAMAAVQDANMNPLRQAANVNVEVQGRDKLVLQTMYTEVIKNLELSKMSMAQETPVVQVIDTPILPLKMKKIGLVMGIVIGLFLGGVVGVAFVIIKRLYKIIIA